MKRKTRKMLWNKLNIERLLEILFFKCDYAEDTREQGGGDERERGRER